ncbi:hypothetical protein GCM10023212_36480 [Luteolibacter yonseiensis]
MRRQAYDLIRIVYQDGLEVSLPHSMQAGIDDQAAWPLVRPAFEKLGEGPEGADRKTRRDKQVTKVPAYFLLIIHHANQRFGRERTGVIFG